MRWFSSLRYDRYCWSWRPLILLVWSSYLLASCTHLHPYYRRNLPKQVEVPKDGEIDHRVLLVGDAGNPDPTGEPTLQLLANVVNMLPDKTTVVFLGDNVYERGMPTAISAVEVPADAVADVADEVLPDFFDSRLEAERNINAQINVVRGNGARAIFIPGNHDWDQFEIGGWDRICNLATYLNEKASDGSANVSILPAWGCPGPELVNLGTRGKLLAIDTQWWLETRTDGKPTADSNPTHCRYAGESEVRDAIISELVAAKEENRWVIVAGHHPLKSNGPHGGFVDLRTHVFPFLIVEHFVPFYVDWIPLPVLGSMVVAARKYFSPSAQDVVNGRNSHMRNAILHPMVLAARKEAAPLLYAAGHDHSLQLFESKLGPRYTLVSGLGSSARASAVGSSGSTLFAHSNPFQPGFMQVDFLVNGGVRLAVIERTKDQPDGFEVFSTYLAKPR